jgi:hypothetical protein
VKYLPMQAGPDTLEFSSFESIKISKSKDEVFETFNSGIVDAILRYNKLTPEKEQAKRPEQDKIWQR